MDDMQTMVRSKIAVDGSVFLLAQGQDIESLKQRVEIAARTVATFVDFVVVGNRQVSVLVSSRTTVVFSAEAVQFDSRDTGDDDLPFGGLFDL